MDDVKDKVKGLMKKVNNPFSSSSSSSSSGRFKGQGRVLGSSSSSSSSSSTPATSQSHSRDPPQQQQPRTQPVTSSTTTTTRDLPQISNIHITQKETTPPTQATNQHLSQCVQTFLSSSSPSGEVVVKLFTNIVKEPENPKFRRIRLSNPKIREAVVEVNGGVELLECVGFMLREENGEMWAVIGDVPNEEQICLIKEAVGLLERGKNGFSLPPGFSIRRKPEVQEAESLVGGGNVVDAEPELQQKIDRQVQVFFSVPESMTAKIDLPESSYSLSATELKREADARKRQIAESQLLIPKSYKEKKAKDAKKKYKSTVIRIQFPDEVVLQGVFLPWEPTTALYEFVSSSLKDPCLEFELWQPAFPKTRVIPRLSGPRERLATLEGEDLVPAALIKFKPIETDSAVFTGLSNELLESAAMQHRNNQITDSST